MEEAGKDIPVRVAVRIRPLITREEKEGCQDALYPENPQVVVKGTDKGFTYDYVFSPETSQSDVYETTVSKMIKELFKGYNVTILAYGQTGSGKTYTMGTHNMLSMNSGINEIGIIPRAVHDIFSRVENSQDQDITIKVSFVELYKETLYDLLNTRTREETCVDIREDPRGGIKIMGLTEISVSTLEETMKCLEQGALNRATGATAMNARSSRSHAIFSLHLEMKNIESNSTICAKFHLVDLAGSERVKKTKATGERFREGVNINKGLLALGNVISALCVEGHKGHIPYRDSKLTRLLQDSLGGNSHTLMIACVSPADSSLEETLSTLRYADRARKIKNRPIINRDPHASELAALQHQVQQLQVQLLAAQAQTGTSVITSSYEVNSRLELKCMLEEENEKLNRALQTALDENTNMAEKALIAEMARDRLKMRLEELISQSGNTVDVLNKTLDANVNPQFGEQINLVKELQKKIIDLQVEQQKNDRAIIDHELSRHSVSTTTSDVDGICGENDAEHTNTGAHTEIFGTAFTLRQAKLNEELQELNRALTLKEELMNKMTANDSHYVVLKSNYEKSLKRYEEQVNILTKEKDELNQQLRSASHNASGKIAEQRRKRMQELECQIGEYRKKILEQSKLLKIKEQAEQRVNVLQTEIQSMKATRVKLVRQMREDNDKFRQWKTQKDREVAKLKEEDRKKQCQIVKMERLHTKQQSVLKRKMEEAVAINKRLKDALAVQKACQEKRALSRDISNVNDRVKTWLDGEVEVVTVKKQAQHSLESLMEDRKTISDRISKLKRQLAKRDLTDTALEELRRRKSDLENELQLRTAQINDLQVKIVEEDNETSTKKRFDSVQSMIEAKCAMQYLFQVATEGQANALIHESGLKELGDHYDEVCCNLEEVEKELKNLKAIHQEELHKLSREHEDKILFLLKQMPKTEDGHAQERGGNSLANRDAGLLKRLQFQEEELARMSNLHEQLQQKTQECEELKAQIDGKESFLGPMTPIMQNSPASAKGKRKQRSKAKRMSLGIHLNELSSSDDEAMDSDTSSEEDEKAIDPDWQKTPLYRRIRQIFTIRGNPTQEDYSYSQKRKLSTENKCSCARGCSNMQCSCKKKGAACCDSCKCIFGKCVNRSSPQTTLLSLTSGTNASETLLNSTFNISFKQDLENSRSKRIRLSNKSIVDGRENTDPLTLALPVFKVSNCSLPPL